MVKEKEKVIEEKHEKIERHYKPIFFFTIFKIKTKKTLLKVNTLKRNTVRWKVIIPKIVLKKRTF